MTIKEVSVDSIEDSQPIEQDLPLDDVQVEAGIEAEDTEDAEQEIDLEEEPEEEPEPEEEDVEEIDGISFFTPVNNLQSSLLANLISTQTKLPCAIVTEYHKKRISHISLAIVDCQGRSIDELQILVRKIQNHKTELRAVLLNAIPESEHETLLDWPCIAGVFFDDTDQEQLNRGLSSLLDGEYWVPRRLLHLFLQKNRRAPNSRKLEIKLTKRERQILKLIKNGATNSDIAKVLEVSEHTVKSHLYNVYKKIGVRNRLEANNWVRDVDTI